jgi:hypothetical protein
VPQAAHGNNVWRVSSRDETGEAHEFDVRITAKAGANAERLVRAARRGYLFREDEVWVASQLPQWCREHVQVTGIPRHDQPEGQMIRQRRERRARARHSAIERLQVRSGSIKWMGAESHKKQLACAELTLRHKNTHASDAYARDRSRAQRAGALAFMAAMGGASAGASC